MSASLQRRALALLLLGSLFLWNAPAMAFPALVDLAHCEETVAPPRAAAPAMPAHHHHAGMDMGMMTATPQVAPAMQPVSMADCLSEHACCSFNREPAQKSNPYSVVEGFAVAERAVPPAVAVAAPAAADPVPAYARPVLDKKTDLRI